MDLEVASETLWRGLCLRMKGIEVQWLPEYEEVSKWLSDNEGKGLFLFGNCGRGKTEIAKYVLPMIFSHFGKVLNCYSASLDMNEKIEEIKKMYLIVIDDAGTESERQCFGVKRYVLPDILDHIEQHGGMIIITSNLTPEELKAKYGERFVDRMRKLTTSILFSGESLRGKQTPMAERNTRASACRE